MIVVRLEEIARVIIKESERTKMTNLAVFSGEAGRRGLVRAVDAQQLVAKVGEERSQVPVLHRRFRYFLPARHRSDSAISVVDEAELAIISRGKN